MVPELRIWQVLNHLGNSNCEVDKSIFEISSLVHASIPSLSANLLATSTDAHHRRHTFSHQPSSLQNSTIAIRQSSINPLATKRLPLSPVAPQKQRLPRRRSLIGTVSKSQRSVSPPAVWRILNRPRSHQPTRLRGFPTARKLDKPIQFRECAHGGVKCMKTAAISRFRAFQSFFAWQRDRLGRRNVWAERNGLPAGLCFVVAAGTPKQMVTCQAPQRACPGAVCRLVCTLRSM